MKSLQLPTVTLAVTSSVLIPEHIKAIEICNEYADFGKVVFLSHEKPDNLPDYVEFKQHEKIKDIMDYNNLMFRDIGDYIETDHALFIQNHAYILNPEIWDDKWLEYDYIGAIWPLKENSYVANNGEIVRNGNGGFSLRSKKLMQLPKKMGWELRQEQGYWNEDGNVTCYWRSEFLNQDIKYAPVDASARFSFETPVEENNWGRMKTFGFHRNMPNTVFDGIITFRK